MVLSQLQLACLHYLELSLTVLKNCRITELHEFLQTMKAKDLRLQNKVAKVVHDRLIIYEKERGDDISEAQGDP